MKKLLFFVAVVFCMSTVAQAQEFKKFKLGLGIGYAMPTDGGGGILATLEPAYRVSDQIAVGLRLESAAMARAIGENEASVSGNGSYTVNGIYYLSNNNFRPYVGLGVGIYSLASASVSLDGDGGATGTATVEAGSQIGFYPRIGFDAGHFNFNIDVNIIPASEPEISLTSPGVEIDDVSNSYIGFRIGAFIFGGRN